MNYLIKTKTQMMMKKKVLILATGCLTLLSTISMKAQLTAGATLRTRSEYRNGQGAPLKTTADPAFFTSQRTRFNIGYSTYRLKFGVAVQDVRVWGQDVSMINRNTTADFNGIMFHEAWAEIMLSDTSYHAGKFSLKLGRQEIMYDDSRVLGNLDWLQQGRRHDAAVFKYTTGKWDTHFGIAFNQNKELASGTLYTATPPGYPATSNAGTMYKGMQYIHAQKKLDKGSLSFLIFADEFNKYHTETVGTVSTKVADLGLWTRVTSGFYFKKDIKNIGIDASGYYQAGKSSAGVNLNAYLLSANVMYNTPKKSGVGIGVDYTSGGKTGGTSNVFDPLYGTPHKFWGYMDYFYVASGFGTSGLMDINLKSKWSLSEKWKAEVDLHQFSAATDITDTDNVTVLSKNLGTEVDITAKYILSKQVIFVAGYSYYAGTSTLTSAKVKNVTGAKTGSDWGYLMIIIKPDLLSK